jgi:hypothetical protein
MWEQPVSALVDPGAFSEDLVMVLTRMDLESFLERNLDPTFTNARARIKDGDKTLGDWIPDALLKDLEEQKDVSLDLPIKEFEGLVPNKLIREVLGGALADTVEELIGKLPGGGGAIFGSLARSAGKLRARTEGWMSGNSGDAESGFSSQVRTLAQNSAESLKSRIIKRLQAPEHAEDLHVAKARIAARILELPLERYLSITDSVEDGVISAWIQRLVVHNLGRPEFQEALKSQCSSLLQREMKRSVGELVSAGRSAKKLKQRWALSLYPAASGFMQSEEFNRWLGMAMTASQSTS